MSNAFHYERKKEMSKRKIAVVLLGIAILVIAGVVIFELMKGIGGGDSNGTSIFSPIAEYGKISREHYGIPSAVFDDLPLPPKDFSVLVSKYHDREFTNTAFFNEQYYLQPEFYPNFLSDGLKYWTSPNYNYYTSSGYGVFPVKQNIELKKGDKKTVRFFLYSGFGVQNWQGIGIVPINLTPNPSIHISMTSSDYLLAPNFPKFIPGWARAVDVIITTDQDIATGSYVIRFKIAPPAPENQDAWAREYGGRYSPTIAYPEQLGHEIIVAVSS